MKDQKKSGIDPKASDGVLRDLITTWRDLIVSCRDELVKNFEASKRYGFNMNPGLVELCDVALASVSAGDSAWLVSPRGHLYAMHYRGALKRILEHARGPLQEIARKALQVPDTDAEIAERKVRLFDAWAKAQADYEGMFEQGARRSQFTEQDVAGALLNIRRAARDGVTLLTTLQAEGRQ